VGQIMEILLLGSVEVAQGGVALNLAGERQRGLVGLLAVEKGKVVTTSRLLNVLWGGNPPLTARTKLQGLVSAFRRQTACQRTPQCGTRPKAAMEYLITRPHGYELRAEGVYADIEDFDSMLARARQAQHAGQLQSAADLYEAALRLWRGPALADVRLAGVRGIAEAIDERRLLAVEAKAELDVMLGRARLVAAELPAWVNDYPLRERLRALLMQALCECGCRADALHLYRTGRETIVAEIGLEPGLELQRLHHWILTGEGVGNPARARTGARMLALTSLADPG
jgi:DNA-binding SARP family transcriptional activator